MGSTTLEISSSAALESDAEASVGRRTMRFSGSGAWKRVYVWREQLAVIAGLVKSRVPELALVLDLPRWPFWSAPAMGLLRKFRSCRMNSIHWVTGQGRANPGRGHACRSIGWTAKETSLTTLSDSSRRPVSGSGSRCPSRRRKVRPLARYTQVCRETVKYGSMISSSSLETGEI